MATEMQQFRGTAAQWASANPILADGELGFERDTKVIKIGDGVTPWNSLSAPPYVEPWATPSRGDLLIGTGLGTAAAVSRGPFGQLLTVQPDGSVIWENAEDFSALESISHAAATYETIALEAIADGQFQSSAQAASTYITISTAATQHSTYETLDHMEATYVSKTHASQDYEAPWIYKVKPANTTRTSTTTLAVDPDLVFPVIAGSVYRFNMSLFLDDASNAADFQIGMTSGLASSWHAGVHGAPTTATSPDSTLNHRMMGTGSTELLVLPISALTQFFYVSIKGVVSVTTTGNFGLTWAQYVSQASPGTILYKGSFLRAQRIA